MSEQGSFMLLFALGPVQTFIAQARKTRDFWTGSLLFSKLMEAAMQEIKPADAFVFPTSRIVEAPDGQPAIPDIPNRYIAIFPTLRQAQEAARVSQEQIARAWQEICNLVWKRIMNGTSARETRQIWERQTGVPVNGLIPRFVQLEAVFDISWAIVDRAEQPDYNQYGLWLAAAEARLAARKRLRDFRPAEEPGEKSTISGEREALRGRDTSRVGVQQFWSTLAWDRGLSARDIDLDGKERLDAIDTIKRFAMEAKAILVNGSIFETPFPSTSTIATATFVERLLEVVPLLPAPALANWRRITREGLKKNGEEVTREIPLLNTKVSEPRFSNLAWLLRRDGDLFFTETFTAKRLRDDYGIRDESRARQLAREGRAALSNLLSASSALTEPYVISPPSSYYGVIQMDGDNMGVLLSGVDEQEEHSRISQALSTFAREQVPDLVQKQYPARLVYAGGDDVLAFAPLAREQAPGNQPATVLDLADRLQDAYQVQLRSALLNQVDPRLGKISASAGLVIAHHTMALSYVLRAARETEALAKQRYGKNALVVTLIRRSGEQTRVGCRWRYADLEEAEQPLRLFARFVTLLKENVLSPKCAHILLEEAPGLVGLEESAVGSEIKRVLMRQRNPEKKDHFTDDELREYARRLAHLAILMDADSYPRQEDGQVPAVELHADQRRRGLVEVLGWLLVAAFLTRQKEQD